MTRLLKRALFEASLTTLGAYWTVRDLHSQARTHVRLTRHAIEVGISWGMALSGRGCSRKDDSHGR